jgi:hypothetical protein
VVGPARVDERAQCGGIEVAPEPECDEQGEADLLGTWFLADPRCERTAAGGGDFEGPAVARAAGASGDKPSFLEGAELAVDVAGGEVSEAGKPGVDLLEKVPPSLEPVVEEAKQIDLSATDDDQLVFETLNDRRTPLLAADLIKNCDI